MEYLAKAERLYEASENVYTQSAVTCKQLRFLNVTQCYVDDAYAQMNINTTTSLPHLPCLNIRKDVVMECKELHTTSLEY